VVVAASACGVRASAAEFQVDAFFSRRIANSSGTVGRYLMDSVGSSGAGYFPQMQNIPPHNHDGTGGMHVYVPWWKYDRPERLPSRLSHRDGWWPRHAGRRRLSRPLRRCGRLWRKLKQAVRKSYGTVLGFSGRGEMIPNHGQLLRN